jgi:hypothetical protein
VALKRQLDAFELRDFHEANRVERATLSIIAVVRHASLRVKDNLNEIKVQLENGMRKNVMQI